MIFGTNSNSGTTTIYGGTLVLGSATALASQSSLVLAGGTLALNGFSPVAFTQALSISVNSILDFGGGNDTLVFADSSGQTWGGTLTLTNFTVGSDLLGFGSATGLNATQLGQIALAGYTVTGLNSSGYVQFAASAIPEPSTYAALAGLGGLGVAIWRRRGRAAALEPL